MHGLLIADPHAPDDLDLVRHVRHGNGIVALWTLGANVAAFAAAIATASRAEPAALAILWFSRRRYGAASLASAIVAAAPSLRLCGCSTAGEVTPDGLQSGGALAILLPADTFEVRLSMLEDIDALGMRRIARHAADERRAFFDSVASRETGPGATPDVDDGSPARPPGGQGELDGPDSPQGFALVLMDGLCFAEEATTAALQRGLGDVPLIGGSAGDDLDFEATDQIVGGRALQRAAVLVLVRTRLAFRLFSDNNFVPAARKLVVTRADPERRIVHEFDAEPAATAYAAALGVPHDALIPSTFATHPLVLRIGGEYYCRSVRHVNADGSLDFFCAIDNGLVLTLARSEGMVRASRATLDRIAEEIGPLECVIGIDCIHRKLDATARGVTHRMEALFREKRFLGFNAYGEQYRSMHVNQTFTGIAFGARVNAAGDAR